MKTFIAEIYVDGKQVEKYEICEKYIENNEHAFQEILGTLVLQPSNFATNTCRNGTYHH